MWDSYHMGRHIDLDAAAIRAALAKAGSVTGAAKELGVSRRTVHRWINKLGLQVERSADLKEAA